VLSLNKASDEVSRQKLLLQSQVALARQVLARSQAVSKAPASETASEFRNQRFKRKKANQEREGLSKARQPFKSTPANQEREGQCQRLGYP
jgi:hypothetical protein